MQIISPICKGAGRKEKERCPLRRFYLKKLWCRLEMKKWCNLVKVEEEGRKQGELNEKNVKENITKERESYEYQQCKNAKSMSYNNELLPVVKWWMYVPVTPT